MSQRKVFTEIVQINRDIVHMNAKIVDYNIKAEIKRDQRMRRYNSNNNNNIRAEEHYLNTHRLPNRNQPLNLIFN